MPLCVKSSTVRFGCRSATDPPHIENSSIGAEPTAATRPRSSLDLVRSYTSQLWAVFCIHVPISETNWPKKKSRKLRCLSAANVCRHGNAPVTTRRGWPVTSSGTVATLAAAFSGLGGMIHQRNRGGPPNGLVPAGAGWPPGPRAT